jgi:phosphatidylserine decarboxylase
MNGTTTPTHKDGERTVTDGGLSMTRYLIMPINRAGWPFIGLFAVAAVILGLVWAPLGWLGWAATLWCVFFFRDPDRVTPVRSGLVISPADGIVCMTGPAVPPPELGMGDATRPRVSVFMSVFDVHVNRSPMDGTVTALAYRPGKFFNASLDKASDENERMSMRLALADGREIAVVQIAGLVARRIKCDVAEGASLKAGQRYGLIRFGSRVDVYLPDGVQPLVAVGQRMLAGETVLADLDATEAARAAAVR